MGKYYVAGIPFDSENSLKHYGVKGMEWNKHKFGIDADDRYIKWLKNAGQNIGRFANNAAQNVAKGATAAAKTVGSAVNKGANFVTGNQARQNMNQAQNAMTQKKQEARMYSAKAQNPVRAMGYAGDTKYARPSTWFDKDAGITGRDYSQQIADQQRAYLGKAAQANQEARELEKQYNDAKSEYDRTAAGALKNIAQNAGNSAKVAAEKAADIALWPATREDVANAARNVGNAVSGAAQNVGQTAQNVAQNVGNFFSNQDEWKRLNDLSKHYNKNTGEWDSEENRKAFYDAQDAYNRHPATAIPDMARQIGSGISNGPIGDFARGVGGMAGEVGNNIKNFVDNNVTGAGQQRFANMYNEWDQQNRADAAEGKPHYDVDAFSRQMQNAANEAREDAKNNTLFGMVGNAANAVGQAAQNVGNAVSGAANKATEGTKGFLNSAGQWVSGAANTVKNTASKAASDASKGASGFLNSAGQWVSNAAGNVGKAAQDAGKAVSNAAQNVGNTVGQAAEQARGGIGGFFDRVGNAVGGAAQNVGNWAGNAAKNVGNAVGGAANAVGNWAGQAAQDVGGAVQNAGDWIGDRAQDVGGAVSGAAQNAVDAVANVPKNIANWYTGNDAREEAQRQRELGNLNQQYGNALMDAARNGNWNSEENRLGAWDEGMRNYLEGGGQLRAADQYMDMYNNAPRQKITNGIQDAASAVGQAARNVGGAVSGAANAVGEWVGDRVSDARDAITAPVRNDIYNQYAKQRDAAYDEGLQKYYETGSASYFPYNPNSPAAQAIDQALDQREQRMNQVNQHPISSAVGYAAGNVADWARNAAGNVADWARNAAGNVGRTANQSNFPMGGTLTEQYIQEERIPEQRIPEQRIPEQLIPEQRISNRSETLDMDRLVNEVYPGRYENFEDYYNYRISHPEWQNYTREDLMDDLIRFEYNKRISHSALNDKPDGVSDAFWEKFTADGGTREEYERDWR